MLPKNINNDRSPILLINDLSDDRMDLFHNDSIITKL